MISDPDDCSGLILRKSNSIDVPLRLQESEAAIQGGAVLQILTDNEFKAQAHKVVSPSDPSIGRMSYVNFVYPPLDLEI
jgi:isopenicillin N synthase-like dioxygenase